jgi:peptidoglycan/LPS O-acetylase OafA/YrhL
MRQEMGASARYRPDVDGLRAFAVVVVLLFHAGFKYFSGGFIGVDVFFVISGYLITKILYDDCVAGRFSYLRFLSRRFFRLYPSLFTVLVLTFAAGFLLLSPEHFKALGESIIGSFFSVSNFVFLQNSGYFAAASETNPLLHTWSLGVEQQFYLVWPVLIVLSFKFKQWAVPVMIFLVGLGSLFISQVYAINAPSQAYFLPQFRGFEFAVGALIPWAERIKPKANLCLELLLLIGLAILVYCTLTYTNLTLFPGLHALVPCIGAALCIYAGTARYLGYFLRNKIVVEIGLMSYSLYLVHWPIIVFYKYYAYHQIDMREEIVLCVTSFVVAYPLYRFIENRFRQLRFHKIEKKTGAATIVLASSMLCLASYVFVSNGAYWRLDKNNVERFADPQKFNAANYGGAGFQGESIFGDKSQTTISAIVIGDSFAGHLMSGLNELFLKNHLKAISIWSSGCLMGPRFVTGKNGVVDQACLAASNRALELIKAYAVPVIYAQSWAGGYKTLSMTRTGQPVSFTNDTEYYQFFRDNLIDIERLDSAGRKVIVVGSPPGDGSASSGVNLKACLDRPSYLPSNCRSSLAFPKGNGIAYIENTGLKSALLNIPNVAFLNPYDFFCSQDMCKSMMGEQIVYSDDVHLSVAGSKMLMDHFAEEILAVLR